MQRFAADTLFTRKGSGWLRLRTLVLLRWLAIFGQLTAILAAAQIYAIQLPLGWCFLTIGAAIIANIVSISIFPQNRLLSEDQALAALLFDLAQLSFLLFLTGGLANPFALLVLTPVTISASALALRPTLILGASAILFVSVIAVINIPLRYADGREFLLPGLFEFGFWLSLVIGVVFLGLYSRRIGTEMRSMSDALLATQMALAREQKLTDLGGVVAAAAHELGTPLATIKLVSSEMIDELADHPEMLEDARLIRDQADRCRDILRSMGKAGKDDLHLRNAPLSAILREAAEPHLERGKAVIIDIALQADLREPNIRRRPELIHGLRNLVQNAVDFSRSTVWIDADWSESRLVLRIIDDGNGFPAQVIGRIGDPFVRSRRAEVSTQERPEYEGMGLGLFIAKTLLERTGAELSFANAADPFLSENERPSRCGAIVEVIWSSSDLLATTQAGLGENQLIA